MPDGRVPATLAPSPATLAELDVDDVARSIVEVLDENATALDALEAFGVEAMLVPRIRGEDGVSIGPFDGRMVASVAALPSSPSSMRALDANTRWALAMVAIAERIGTWAPRSSEVHAFAHRVAARVLELRGRPLLVDGAERWHELVEDALEIGRLLVENRRARTAALEVA